jgi:trigger factor
MQVSVETTSGLERRLTVAVPAERLDSAVEQRLLEAQKTCALTVSVRARCRCVK